MTEADTNRMEFSYHLESTFNVAPGAAPSPVTSAYRFLRLNSHTLKQNTATGRSDEVVSDRNVTKNRRLGIDASGDVVCDFSRDTGFEDLIQTALQDPSSWTPISPEDNTVSITAPDQITRGSGDFTTNTSVGDYVLLSGFSTAANNRPCKVEAVVTLAITTHNTDLITESLAAGKFFTQGVAIKNTVKAAGTPIDSYSFQDEFTDLTNEFAVYRGGTLDGFTIDVTAEGFINITFNIMGASEEAPRPTANKDDGTIIAAGTALQFTAVDDVVAITDSDLEVEVIGFTIVATNNNHARKIVGLAGPKSMGTGRFELSGTVTGLYEDSTDVDKHLAYEETDLALLLMNGTDDAYVCEVPSLQYSSGDTPQAGISQDVIQTLTWEAQKETTAPAGETIRATFRFWKFK